MERSKAFLLGCRGVQRGVCQVTTLVRGLEITHKQSDLKLDPFQSSGMGTGCHNFTAGSPSPFNTSNSHAYHVLPLKVPHAAWLSTPLHGSSLRQRAQGIAWTPSGAQHRTTQEATPAYQSQSVAPSATANLPATGPPPELFQNALSALDLFSSSGSTITDSHDPPEEIAVDHGQTAASVGRAIYEVC